MQQYNNNPDPLSSAIKQVDDYTLNGGHEIIVMPLQSSATKCATSFTNPYLSQGEHCQRSPQSAQSFEPLPLAVY